MFPHAATAITYSAQLSSNERSDVSDYLDPAILFKGHFKGQSHGIQEADPRSCVKVEVDVLGSPSLIVRMVRICGLNIQLAIGRALCESRGGRLGLPVPNSPYGLCGRKATISLI